MNTTSVEKTPTAKSDAPETTRTGAYYQPAVDIVERAEELLVSADMPGVKPDAISIRFEDGELSIHGPVEPRQAPDNVYLLREYGVGDYQRTFRVSERIDATRIAAEYAGGVLTLHLPKVETAKPRKIPVKLG
jgi:HSP20 family protein